MITWRNRFAAFVVGAALAGHVQSGNAQEAPQANPEAKILLQVVGHIAQPLSLSQDQLAKLPRQTVRAKSHDGSDDCPRDAGSDQSIFNGGRS